MTLALSKSRFFLILLAMAWCSVLARGQASEGPVSDESTAPPTTAEMLKKVDQLVQQNQLLEKQNRELMEQITTMRQALTTKQPDAATEADVAAQAIRQAVAKETQPSSCGIDSAEIDQCVFLEGLQGTQSLSNRR